MTADLEELRPYQLVGARWLASTDQAMLADDMGIGKTCQAIHACDMRGFQNILVACPSSVRVGWEREFEKFSPMDRNCHVVFDTDDPLPPSGVVVVSYDLLVAPDPRPLMAKAQEMQDPTQKEKTLKSVSVLVKTAKRREEFLRKLKSKTWDVLILDEAHYLKERTADRTKAIYGHGRRFPGLEGSAPVVWRLTGTPAPNDVSELYTHLKSAGVTDVPYWDFVFRYCTGLDHEHGFKITGHKNVDELKKLLGGFMLRRTKDQVDVDLPEIIFTDVVVERSKVELDPEFYEEIQGKRITEQQFFERLKVNDTTLRNVLNIVNARQNAVDNSTVDTRLKLLESMAGSLTTLRRYIAMAKLPAILNILEEELKTKQIDKLVIFGVHKCVIEGCRKRLKKYGAVTLYGGTPAKARQENIDRFTHDPACRVFIGNIEAAGIGVNGLQNSCCEVAVIEQDYVPARNSQAIMRVHRIGQTRKVRVRIFTLHQSVDQQVQGVLMRKTRELCKVF